MKDKKKILLSVFGVVLIMIATIGISLAFFNYTRTGRANTIEVGRISFVTRQTETINLTNVFPISRDTLTNDPTNENIGIFEIEIEGDTDYTGGVEYLVSVVNSNITTSTGQIVPISLDVEVTDLGDSSNNYFTARNNTNTTIYKRLSGNGIMGDGMILVGYIPQNNPLGTPDGIDGSITIKAFLDADKIAISDTYDGTESDLMGTTNEWVGDRVVLTTNEWNSLQNTGLSFRVRVEANEGIWVEETLYDVIERQSVMDNIQSTYVSAQTGIDFSKISGDTDSNGVIDNGEGVYTFSSTANDAYPVHYFRGAVTNNNVYFANKCWLAVRTTDTGGVKLIYNGENTGTNDAPACENTGTDTQITLNVNGTDVNTFAFNENSNSLAYSGYMYGTVYSVTNEAYTDGAYFGNSFTYDDTNEVYTLTNAKVGIDETHHYTCNSTSASGICDTIRYYFLEIEPKYYYISLTRGKSIENAIEEMQTNENNSSAKAMIDTWYATNIENNASYANMLEDTIWCNDRSISYFGGFNPDGGGIDSSLNLFYSGYTRANTTYNPSLSCRKSDSFTLPNGRGNGDLTYPVGLITNDEIMLAGAKFGTRNKTFYLKSGATYWSLTSYTINDGIGRQLTNSSQGSPTGSDISLTYGLRPVLSLKNGTQIVDNGATGTSSNPYVIK